MLYYLMHFYFPQWEVHFPMIKSKISSKIPLFALHKPDMCTQFIKDCMRQNTNLCTERIVPCAEKVVFSLSKMYPHCYAASFSDHRSLPCCSLIWMTGINNHQAPMSGNILGIIFHLIFRRAFKYLLLSSCLIKKREG